MPTSTEEVYGATVKLIDARGQIQMQRYNPQRGFISSMEHVLHFGTGTQTVIPRVEITFPSKNSFRKRKSRPSVVNL